MAGPDAEKQSLANMDFDGWAETFAVNTMAPLRMVQTFRRNLKAGKNPRAITITSQMGALALNMPVMFAYCSSKAAVNKVMRMASVELASDGIAVGLIHPGWVRTDMGGSGADISAEDSAAGIMSVIANLTLGRYRQLQEVERRGPRLVTRPSQQACSRYRASRAGGYHTPTY